MSRRIAIVEDDPDQAANYADALRRNGFDVVIAGNHTEARTLFAASLPDLVILDIVLGSEIDGGFAVCRELLADRPGLPVVFLTSRADEIDRISGLRLGAWDYQTKPVSLSFLVERVSSLFRIMELKNQPHQAGPKITIGLLEIDEARTEAYWRNQSLPLTITEYHILQALVHARNERGASYDKLNQATRQSVVENNTINTHIRHLRRKFCEIDPEFDCIRNVYGFGYRWSCQ